MQNYPKATRIYPTCVVAENLVLGQIPLNSTIAPRVQKG